MINFEKLYILKKFKKKNKYNACGCGKYRRSNGDINDKCPSVGLAESLPGCYYIQWDFKFWENTPRW